jgi:hypothetical protein
MVEIKRYDTVTLREAVGGYLPGEKGAVVEVYETPSTAYDVEIVTDDGKTLGLIEGVRPEQIELFHSPTQAVRLSAVQIEANGLHALVHFSDGAQVVVKAQALYKLARHN